MELYNLNDKQIHDLEKKIEELSKKKEEKGEIDLNFRIEGDKKPFLSIPIYFIHNPIIKDKFPQLHVDIIDGFYHLLQKKFPENVYLTCWFIQSYKNYQKKIKPIEIEDGAMNTDFINLKSKKKLLDNMLKSIDKKEGFIFFPIFIELGHFALVVFDCKKQTLTYYDSLLEISEKDEDGFTEFANEYMDMVVYYIIDYYNTLEKNDLMKKSKVLTSFVENFKEKGDFVQSDDMPQQKNIVDCGVYCCLMGYILSNKEKIPEKFYKKQIYSMRLKIKEALFEGEIKEALLEEEIKEAL